MRKDSPGRHFHLPHFGDKEEMDTVQYGREEIIIQRISRALLLERLAVM